MKLIVDAMGGDNAPEQQIKGSCKAARELGVDIVLCGKKSEIEPILIKYAKDVNNISIKDCSEVIENEDDPVTSARRKKDSSIVVGLSMVKNGEGDAFVSSGNTGAIIAASIFTLKRIKGVSRPALAPIIPAKNGPTLIVDSGANAVCKPENLYDFGVMGSYYMQSMFNIENPRVGLVNIGTEEHKGTDVTREAYKLLENSDVNFVGNIEARDVIESKADVLVTDGFTGNIVIKLIEGTSKFLFSQIKSMFMKNFATKLAALALKKEMKIFKARFNYKEHGGAPLLGVDGVVIKAHGSSDDYAFFNALRQAKTAVNGGLIEKIKSSFETEPKHIGAKGASEN